MYADIAAPDLKSVTVFSNIIEKNGGKVVSIAATKSGPGSYNIFYKVDDQSSVDTIVEEISALKEEL